MQTLPESFATPSHPIGTQYLTKGKRKDLCTVIDYHVTRNMAGEIVKAYYVSSHAFMGQSLTSYDVPRASVDMGIAELRSHPLVQR